MRAATRCDSWAATKQQRASGIYPVRCWRRKLRIVVVPTSTAQRMLAAHCSWPHAPAWRSWASPCSDYFKCAWTSQTHPPTPRDLGGPLLAPQAATSTPSVFAPRRPLRSGTESWMRKSERLPKQQIQVRWQRNPLRRQRLRSAQLRGQLRRSAQPPSRSSTPDCGLSLLLQKLFVVAWECGDCGWWAGVHVAAWG